MVEHSLAVSRVLRTVRLLDRRYSSRFVLYLGLMFMAAATLLFAWSSSYNSLVLARSLQGICSAATWSAALNLIPRNM
jgi:MFS family permease